MNYYEHHIGDYTTATAHLSFVEDAAYSRLLRIYYRDEKPLPSDLKVVQRLAGARSRDEKQAVDVVLEEFFHLGADGWRNKRADEEIARYLDKRDKARRSANARWSAERNDAEDMRTHSERDAYASKSHSDRNAYQAPHARHQTPEGNNHHSGNREGGGRTAAGCLAVALNRAGLPITSYDPRLIEAANLGIAAEEVMELRHVYPGKPAAYLLKAAINQRAERAKESTDAACKPRRRLSAVESVRANVERARRERGELPDDDQRGCDNVIEGTAARLPN